MNVLKIQQEVLKALCKGERVYYYHTDEGVFLSTNGVNGWIVPEEHLHVSLAGAQVITDLGAERLFTAKNKLIGTDEYRKGGVARRYKPIEDPTTSVYVNTNLLKYFDAPVLYQGPNVRGPIAVVEQPIDSEPLVVGLVMPVAIKDDDWAN